MRCLIAIVCCFALASANYMTENRFQKMLNRNQDTYDRYEFNNENLYGSDDVDENMADYMDEHRAQRMMERDQCPRDSDLDFEHQYETEFDDIRGRRDYTYGDERSEESLGSDLLKEVEDANVKLASRLYKECKDEKDDKNTVVSPIAVQIALAALNDGARGNTNRQIGRVIGGRLNTRERKQVLKPLIRQLKKLRTSEYGTRPHTTKINPVTGIFITTTTRAQQIFVQRVKLGATVKQCNFERQPQQCRQMINRFVAEKTQGKINRIVPQDAITDNTKMILVNAMELKATWGPEMRRHMTKEAKFYPLDTKKVKIVEVMETKGRFKYYEDELVKIVGLPTEQKELTMYVIVPKDKDGLTEVEKLHLQDGVQLKQLLDVTDQRVRHVGVQLPKFQIKHKIDVRRTLRKQGVTDAFDSQRADFSGITGTNKHEQEEMEGTFGRSPLFRRNPFLDTDMDDEMTTYSTGEKKLHLNKFIHQCTIKITENGITSTTGSEGRMDDKEEYMRRGRRVGFESEEMDTLDEVTGFYRREPTGEKMVKANRAFAFVVKHNPTNQLLLVGRVIDAAQKKINNLPQTINNVDQL